MMRGLENYLSTLSVTSYDRNSSKSLVEDEEHEVYNFDHITKDLCSEMRGGESLSSCDALSFSEDFVYLIEFKNQPLRNIERKVIQKKAFDSVYLLMNTVLPDKPLEWFHRHLVLYIVHRGKEKDSFSSFRDRAATLAGVEAAPDFGLSKYYGLYREIYTLSSKEFSRRHIRRIFREPSME